MLQKMARLKEIAAGDQTYLAWSQIYAEAQVEFDAYANAQPKEIQDILRGYAEGGRLKYQRLTNLACMYMDFCE